MKRLISYLLAALAVAWYWSECACAQNTQEQRIFRIKDKAGNVILETEDSTLIGKFTNVKVEVTNNSTKIFTLPSDTVIEDARLILKKMLGDSAIIKSTYYYSIEWQTPGGGSCILNKYSPCSKSKPQIIADWKAQKWLRSNIVGLIE